jgi:PiT family inorganic phosphate transporter
MSGEYAILIIGYIFGFYMAWNIGANDVANSMASAVGAKAITIRKGIVSTQVLEDPHLALIGAVVLSWVISPVFSLVIAFVLFKIIVRLILAQTEGVAAAFRWSAVFIGCACFVVVLSFLFKTPLGKNLSVGTPAAVLAALVLAGLLGVMGKILIKRYVLNTNRSGVEEIFRRIQIATSCYVALAQGANDVANAIGPLAVIYFLVKTGAVGDKVPVPIFLLLFGGVGIACGIWMAGHRVMTTIGTKITTLTNTRGFCVDFSAATTVLIASKLGLPVSTTHAAVGGVMGVGVARGMEAVNFRIVLLIMLYWVLTVPAAAVTSMLLFWIIRLFY